MNILFILGLCCIPTGVFGIGYKISRTEDNSTQCMTPCIRDNSNRYYCYYAWTHWDRCIIRDTDETIQYYTSLKRGSSPHCYGACGNFGESYEWCFTSENSWDYCSTKQKDSCRQCTKYSDGYKCEKVGTSEKYENCAPDPISERFFKNPKNIFDANCPSKNHLRRPRGHSKRQTSFNEVEEYARESGVLLIAFDMIRTYHTIWYHEPSQPIESITTVCFPPPQGSMLTTTVPLVIRARIRRNHLRQVAREPIPNFIRHQMTLMDAIPGVDDAGHLLASSLGGPSHDFNFAPQTSAVNRNAGGEQSYWYRIEGELREILRNNTVDHINWCMVVIYGNIWNTRRPIGFGLRFRVMDTNGRLTRDSGDLFFNNDRDGPDCPI